MSQSNKTFPLKKHISRETEQSIINLWFKTNLHYYGSTVIVECGKNDSALDFQFTELVEKNKYKFPIHTIKTLLHIGNYLTQENINNAKDTKLGIDVIHTIFAIYAHIKNITTVFDIKTVHIDSYVFNFLKDVENYLTNYLTTTDLSPLSLSSKRTKIISEINNFDLNYFVSDMSQIIKTKMREHRLLTTQKLTAIQKELIECDSQFIKCPFLTMINALALNIHTYMREIIYMNILTKCVEFLNNIVYFYLDRSAHINHQILFLN